MEPAAILPLRHHADGPVATQHSSLGVALAAAAAILFAAGCGNTRPGAASATAANEVTGAAPWDSVSETAACEAMNPAYCLGAFGFVVFPTGAWRVGPTPGGDVRRGQVESGSLADFSAAIRSLVDQQSQHPGCAAFSGRRPGAMFIPGIRSVVTLALPGGRHIDIGGPSDRLDHPCPATPESDAVRAKFQALLAKYYPTPFPG